MWWTTGWASGVEIPTSTSPNAAQFCQPTSPITVQLSPIACEKPSISVCGTFSPRSIVAVSSRAAATAAAIAGPSPLKTGVAEKFSFSGEV
jgi:hypothetical protein